MAPTQANAVCSTTADLWDEQLGPNGPLFRDFLLILLVSGVFRVLLCVHRVS